MPSREPGFISRVEVVGSRVPSFEQYPFCIPAVASLVHPLVLHPRVTFFVGENGCGKSTLIEGIAVAAGFNPEGGSRNFSFSTRSSESVLDRSLRLTKTLRRPRTGFFLRSESFFNLATNIEEMDRIPAAAPLIIDSYGGRSLHEQSHGESFFALFCRRFGHHGLYILDEPEAALSPMRLLAFLRRLHELAQGGSQFIIATHSPLLLAYPDAQCHLLSEEGIRALGYQQTEHWQVTKRFMADPDSFMAQLLADDEE